MQNEPHRRPMADDVTRRAALRTSQNSEYPHGISRRPGIEGKNQTPRLTSRSANLRATDRDDGILGASVTRDRILYLAVGALVIVTAVLSYQLYQDRKQPEGMRIDLGPNGLSIEKK
jgi:hypothetical protein